MSTIKADAITASTGTNTNIGITGKGSGKVKLGDGNLLFPDSDGSANQYIKTDGSANLAFATLPTAGFTLGTEQATTSGTSKTFSGIPAGVTMVSLLFFGVSYSASGQDTYIIQLGDSGGIETSGYVSSSTMQSSQDFASTNAFGLELDEGERALHGIMTFALEDSSTNTWVASGVMRAGTPRILFVGGSKPLSGVLTQLKISGVTFDAGALNILYQ